MSTADSNSHLIQKFYQAFASGNAQEMVDCYHEEIQFEDPAFGKLNAVEAKIMWKMLVERGGSDLKISYKDAWADENIGKATWEARYFYGPKKRKVHNIIHASFQFKDGKIIHHKDDFDLFRWSRQALGLTGYLLGWTGFMRKKIQAKTKGLLEKYKNLG